MQSMAVKNQLKAYKFLYKMKNTTFFATKVCNTIFGILTKTTNNLKPPETT